MGNASPWQARVPVVLAVNCAVVDEVCGCQLLAACNESVRLCQPCLCNMVAAAHYIAAQEHKVDKVGGLRTARMPGPLDEPGMVLLHGMEGLRCLVSEHWRAGTHDACLPVMLEGLRALGILGECRCLVRIQVRCGPAGPCRAG